MELTACPDCSGLVLNISASCPHCGINLSVAEPDDDFRYTDRFDPEMARERCSLGCCICCGHRLGFIERIMGRRRHLSCSKSSFRFRQRHETGGTLYVCPHCNQAVALQREHHTFLCKNCRNIVL